MYRVINVLVIDSLYNAVGLLYVTQPEEGIVGLRSRTDK